MPALTALESKRFSRLARLAAILASQQKAKSINPHVARRAARVLILATDKPDAAVKRIARYGVKRRSQPKASA